MKKDNQEGQKKQKRQADEEEQIGWSKRRKFLLIGGCLLVLLIGAVSATVIYSYNTRVYKRCVFEAGVEISPEDFLKKEGMEIAFAKDSKPVDTKVPGDYPVKLKSGMFTYECTATVQDTIPPTGEAVDVYFEEGQMVGPEQFVTSIQDETEVTVSYVKEPDYSIHGKQQIEVALTDAGANQTVISSNLITRVTVKELTLEAGEAIPEIAAFLLSEEGEAAFVTDLQTVPVNQIGDYDIEIAIHDTTYITVLHVQDTVAPVVKSKNATTYKSKEIGCEAFIASAKDATALNYQFVIAPDVSLAGEQPVSIQVTDAGGNSVTVEAVVTVVEDTQPPVISGAADFSAYIGGRINYKGGISVWDDYASSPKLTVDTSQVNVNAEGTYPVTYIATDDVGNQSSVTVYITMKQHVLDESEVYWLADGILAKIISPGMSSYDKLTAIYNWVRGNLGYVNSSEKGNWVNAAYQGLANRQGDCYVYACTAKALLTRAGIDNRDIEKIPSYSRHYWNLVDIGGGWYHFDTTPRKGETTWFCYISDAELMSYSVSHHNSHNYDRSIYTDIQ